MKLPHGQMNYFATPPPLPPSPVKRKTGESFFLKKEVEGLTCLCAHIEFVSDLRVPEEIGVTNNQPLIKLACSPACS